MVILLPVGVGRDRIGLIVNWIYAITVGFFVTETEYPRESVALNINDVSEQSLKILTLSVGATPLINFEAILAEFCAVAVMVAFAIDLYRINFELSPVNATVAVLVSTTLPETVGAPVAVIVIVQVVALPNTLVLPELLYVRQVIVHLPVGEFGIWA